MLSLRSDNNDAVSSLPCFRPCLSRRKAGQAAFDTHLESATVVHVLAIMPRLREEVFKLLIRALLCVAQRMSFCHVHASCRFMPNVFSMIGFGRSPYDDDKLRDKIKGHLEGSDKEKDDFLKKV